MIVFSIRSPASLAGTVLAFTVMIAPAMSLGGRTAIAQSPWQRLQEVFESPSDNPMPETTGPFNLPLKTAGGQQLWTDFRNRDGYRLQQNSLTSHWRLIDPTDVRRAWGTKDDCLTALEPLRSQADMLNADDGKSKHVVVLLHGLMRTSRSMNSIQTVLGTSGFDDSISFSYASTRHGIGDHATALRELLEDLPPSTTFSFVGHSMGNIVVRHLVGDLQADGDANHLLRRCWAMVMLGPPNNGASIARNMAKTGIYGWVTGKGGMELGPQFDELKSRLAIPPFPFAIVAGDVSDMAIQNPLTDGAGDFVVSTEEAALEGAKHFKTIPQVHSFLMDHDEAQQFVVEFLTQHIGASD